MTNLVELNQRALPCTDQQYTTDDISTIMGFTFKMASMSLTTEFNDALGIIRNSQLNFEGLKT
jgi:hypothetical protein